jgi:GMP synthase (glutamine-hydrolysing)
MILIINCGSLKTIYIEQAVDLISEYKTVDFKDNYLDLLKNVKGVIISGAPILITEIDYSGYVSLFSWVKSFEKPILGICFGHQILGLLFESLPSRQKEDRDWQTIAQLEESILFDKLPDEFEMMEDHCESISLPKNFKLIATSDACINEAMQHETKPYFGVQFHPEISGNYGQIVIHNFIEYCLLNKNN